MNIGMNLLLWTDHVIERHDELLEHIKEIGFDAVEVPIFDTSDIGPYERLGRRLRALDLRATAVTVMTMETNPIAIEPHIRDKAVEHLDRVMECGQAFGAEILCGPVHSAIGVFSGEAPTEEEFQRGVDTLKRVGEKAETRGIMIAVEYLNRFENFFLTTAAQTSRFVQAVDHPSIRMMYDSFHAHIEEKSQIEAVLSCANETIHVHISENDRGTPGTGQVDWEGVFTGLKESGYDGFLTIEAFGRSLPALAAATKVWRDLFPDALGLCRDGYEFIKSQAR